MRLSLARLALLLLALAPAAVRPASAGSAVIVLDGSGSMGGPLDGQSAVKFDMAREAIRSATVKAAPSSSLGLLVAGHRRKSNCSDIEFVTPPAPGTAAAMMARLDRIGTVGKGPIVEAVRDAAKSYPAGVAGSLVLIHDGPDNCKQDPCDAAEALAKSNPKLAVHTITLSLDPAVAASIACLSKATGGKAYVARSADDLSAHLTAALEAADVIARAAPESANTTPPPSAAPAVAADASEGPPRIRLLVSMSEGGPPLSEAVSWRIAAAAKPAEPIIERSAATVTEPLAAGPYLVEARLGLVTHKAEIEVAPEGETFRNLALDAGRLKITARASKTAEAMSNPLVSVYEVGKGRRSSEALGDAVSLDRKQEARLVLPAGQYVVEVADGHAVKQAAITLTAGTEAAADFVMGTGRLDLNTAAAEGGDPLSDVAYVIEIDDPEAPQGRREFARSASPSPSFLLPAGTYYATAELGAASVKERIAIGSGDVVKRVLNLGAGTLTFAAEVDPVLVPAAGTVSYRVFRDGQAAPGGSGGGEIAHTSASPATLTLPAGRYRVEGRIDRPALKTEGIVDVAPGVSGRAVLKFAAAEVTVKPAPPSATQATRWDLRDQTGHVVLRADGATPRSAVLTPGRYTLRTEAGDTRREIPLELKPGERRQVVAGEN